MAGVRGLLDEEDSGSESDGAPGLVLDNSDSDQDFAPVAAAAADDFSDCDDDFAAVANEGLPEPAGSPGLERAGFGAVPKAGAFLASASWPLLLLVLGLLCGRRDFL